MQTLIKKFDEIKHTLPKGRLSRWQIARELFEYHEPSNYAADDALAEMKWYGELTKSRWIAEYRHQRAIRTYYTEE